MTDLVDLFWNSPVEDIMKGFKYLKTSEEYICLLCGEKFVQGIIYQDGDQLYDAGKYAEIHIALKHTSVFDYLIGLDKKITGLTDHQRKLLILFKLGLKDSEMAKEMDCTNSTIRNHRFSLYEKEKQAKIFLAIMGLLSKNTEADSFLNIHRTAKSIDERYAITQEEYGELLKRYFPKGLDGPLMRMPLKQKGKIAILKHIITRFDSQKKYTEKEINELLKNIYSDYITLRRYLIDYGFLNRYTRREYVLG